MGQSKLVLAGNCRFPEGGETRTVVAPDSVEIRCARWPAASGVPKRGTVVLFNGRTEFIEKYCEVLCDLTERGFAVVTLDWRGQGLSSRLLTNRTKGFVGAFADFVRDARMVIDLMVGEDLPRPYLLLAHSMGGNIGLRLAQEDAERFDKIVLCAPMTGLGGRGTPVALMRAVAIGADTAGLGSRFAPGQHKLDASGQDPFEGNIVTSDQTRFDRAQAFLREEPRLGLGGVTWRWLRQALASIDLVTSKERLRCLTAPVLIVSADEDKIVDSQSHHRLARMSPNISLVPVPGAEHEILMEKDALRNRFWYAFDRFTEPGDGVV